MGASSGYGSEMASSARTASSHENGHVVFEYEGGTATLQPIHSTRYLSREVTDLIGFDPTLESDLFGGSTHSLLVRLHSRCVLTSVCKDSTST